MAGRALCHFQGLVSFPISISTLGPSKFSFFASFPRTVKFSSIQSDGHHPPARSWTCVQCLRSPSLTTPPPFSRCFGGFSPLSTFRFNFSIFYQTSKSSDGHWTTPILILSSILLIAVKAKSESQATTLNFFVCTGDHRASSGP